MRKRAPFFLLVTGLAGLAGPALARALPDVSARWNLACLAPYKTIVSAMDPKLIPESLSNGFEIRDSNTAARTDKKADRLYVKNKTAYLTGIPTVPWLTIYNRELKPVYHALGYNSRSEELWQMVLEQNRPTEFAPELSDISSYSDLDPASLPAADFTFVDYYAPWCTNCALMEAAIAEFQQAHTALNITHVRIHADTRKMQKKKYRAQSCPDAKSSPT